MQRQTMLPNQEIILRFENKNVPSSEVLQTVEIIKKQLQLLGIDDVQLYKSPGRQSLRITYYSAVESKCIQNFLSDSPGITKRFIVDKQDPEEPVSDQKDTNNEYIVSVYDLQAGEDTTVQFLSYILQKDTFKKLKNDLAQTSSIFSYDIKSLENVSGERNRRYLYAELFSDSNANYIPESRAGPFS